MECCLTGTSINRMPTLGNKDLNLHRLFNIVQTMGGYNKVGLAEIFKLKLFEQKKMFL